MITDHKNNNFPNGVINYTDNLVALDELDINNLIKKVDYTEKKRIRICLHNPDDSIHEMIVLVKKGSYIRPAKHLNKTESLHVIKGRAKAIFFSENGNIESVKLLSEFPNSFFMYKMNTDIYHTLIVETDYFIFHEITNGPLIRADTIEAIWSPKENDNINREEYLSNLNNRVNSLNIN